MCGGCEGVEGVGVTHGISHALHLQGDELGLAVGGSQEDVAPSGRSGLRQRPAGREDRVAVPQLDQRLRFLAARSFIPSPPLSSLSIFSWPICSIPSLSIASFSGPGRPDHRPSSPPLRPSPCYPRGRKQQVVNSLRRCLHFGTLSGRR